MDKEVVYEQHPVSAERKADLLRKGYKIIDARFAPADYKHPDPIKKGSDGGADRPSKGLNVDQIKAALTEKGIEFDASANKPVLAELLDKADQE